MLMAEFDARTWSGATVFTVSATNVVLPTYGTGEGVFEDVLAFLNGYGSRGVAASLQHLGGLIDDAWTGGANAFTVTINSSDRVVLTSDTIDFAITASTNLSQLGFTAATYAAVGGAAPFVRTAEADWTRGVIGPLSITIDPAGAGAAYTITTRHVQSVPTLIRSAAEGDADGSSTVAAGCLERSMQDDLAIPSYRAGITDSSFSEGAGHVFISYPATSPAPTWGVASFAARLGFRGDEVEQTSGTSGYVVGTYPCPGVYYLSRGYEELILGTLEEGSAVRLTNGVQASNHIGTYDRATLSFIVDGPAQTTDLHRHFLQRFVPYIPRGRRLTLYQDWGDPRRALSSFDVTTSQSAYDLLYTSEPLPGTTGTGGYRGRLRLRHSADAATGYEARWANRIRQRAPITMLLDEAGD